MFYRLTVNDHLLLEPVVSNHENLELAESAAADYAGRAGLTVVIDSVESGGRPGADYFYRRSGRFIDSDECDLPWADYVIAFDAGIPGGL